jgi:Condensin II complex subunit CAP-H2 or CNDH2, N-terminal/Condensin II complex subunit CAP-H2 or CNDH2, C-term
MSEISQISKFETDCFSLLYAEEHVLSALHRLLHPFSHVIAWNECTFLKSLEDFLQEISSVVNDEDSITHSNSVGTATNFAQAALLLYNSSSVYSRKVEYLYTLVYAALENLNSQNLSSTINPKHGVASSRKLDPDVEEFEQYDPNFQFLLLDDIIPTDEGDKIDLPNSQGSEQQTIFDMNASAFFSNNTRLSLGMSTTADRSGASAPVSSTKILTSLTNNHSCGILHNQTEGNSQGIFYMRGTTSTSTESLLDSSNRRASSLAADDIIRPFSTYDDDAMDFSPTIATDEVQWEADDDDHDNDGSAFQLAEVIDTSKSAAPINTLVARQSRRDLSWNFLDPHDPEQTKGRPLKKGSTYILPEGFTEPPSAFVTGSSTRILERRIKKRSSEAHDLDRPKCIAVATFKALMEKQERARLSFGSESSKCIISGTKIDSIPFLGLAFGEEFAYMAKASARRKAAELRGKRKLLKKDPLALPVQEVDQLLGYDDYGVGDHDDNDSHAEDNQSDNGGSYVFDQAFGMDDSRK